MDIIKLYKIVEKYIAQLSTSSINFVFDAAISRISFWNFLNMRFVYLAATCLCKGEDVFRKVFVCNDLLSYSFSISYFFSKASSYLSINFLSVVFKFMNPSKKWLMLLLLCEDNMPIRIIEKKGEELNIPIC